MKTVKELLTELGGPKKLGGILKISPSNIVFWGQKNTIPVIRWPKIIELCHEAQIECNPEILLRMVLNRPRKD